MSQNNYLILFLCLPAVCGGIVALINSAGTNEFTEKVEAWIRRRQGVISFKKGFFWKWIVHPPFRVVVKLCDWTDSLAHRGVKNGIRFAIVLYVITIWVLLVMYAFMFIVGLILAAIAVYIALWIIGKVSGVKIAPPVPNLRPKNKESKPDEDFRKLYVPDPDVIERTYNQAQKIGSEGGSWSPFMDVWKGAFESEESYNARKKAWEEGMKNGLKNRRS